MNTRITLVALACLAVSACATPSYNYVPEVERVSYPELGTTNTVSVGDKMVSIGNVLSQDGFELGQSMKVGSYTLTPGFYKKVGDKDEYDFFSPTTSGVNAGFLADPFQTVAVSKDKSKICAVSIYNIKNCKDAPSLKFGEMDIESPSSFEQTLLYNGRVGDKVNIGYREFSGSLARPAFNNEVEYDLNEDRTIAYKGAEIEILEADNRSITYRVISNFTPVDK